MATATPAESATASLRCHAPLLILLLVNFLTWGFLGISLLVAVVVGGPRHRYVASATVATPATQIDIHTAAGNGVSYSLSDVRSADLEASLISGSSPNVLDAGGNSPLFYAVSAPHVANALYLLERGADPNLRGMNSDPPLIAAVSNSSGDRETVLLLIQMLLEHGANPSDFSPNGMGAMPSMGEIASPGPFVTRGSTAAHVAARRGFASSIQELAAWGADLNAKDEAGNTPLHVAIQPRNEDVIEALLANGADPDIENGLGQSPRLLGSGDSAIQAVFNRHSPRRAIEAETAGRE